MHLADRSFIDISTLYEGVSSATTCSGRPAMAVDRTPVSNPQTHGPASRRFSVDGRCGVVDHTHRRAMARPAGTIREVEDRVPLVQQVGTRWNMGSRARSTADSSRSRGTDRLGSMVHRWQQYPGEPRSCRRRQKGGAGEPQDHALGRSRGGFGTKLHMVTDGNGLPLAIHVTPGQRHESTQFEEVMNAVRIRQPRGRPRTRPAALAGDKGYSYPRIRRWLRDHSITDVIPRRSDQQVPTRGRQREFDKDAYRRRSIIECCIGWLKECRRVATRFEKLAINYLATVKVAIVHRYLNILFSDRA